MKEKMTNFRWMICSLLFFATTVNYLDRQVKEGVITPAERSAIGH